VIAADTHPDYLSSQYARASGTPVELVQHHLAHIAAVLAENEVNEPALGVSWDGTGLGADGTIWGGEFLRVKGATWERVAHLRPFPLPGGDLVAREPRRSALGLLMEWQSAKLEHRSSDRSDQSDLLLTLLTARKGFPLLQAFTSRELELLVQVIRSRINTPLTSSVGRLFDAVASLLGLRHRCQYEGQAAMELEAAAAGVQTPVRPYPMPLRSAPSPQSPQQLDWAPMLEELVADLRVGVEPGVMARRFHEALVEAVASVALRIGEQRVALGGGCFQNQLLLEGCVRRLRGEGFRVYWPQRVPPNDGGLALGQVAWVRRLRSTS
jgi:hydrogenase maturation protein HypF